MPLSEDRNDAIEAAALQCSRAPGNDDLESCYKCCRTTYGICNAPRPPVTPWSCSAYHLCRDSCETRAYSTARAVVTAESFNGFFAPAVAEQNAVAEGVWQRTRPEPEARYPLGQSRQQPMR